MKFSRLILLLLLLMGLAACSPNTSDEQANNKENEQTEQEGTTDSVDDEQKESGDTVEDNQKDNQGKSEDNQKEDPKDPENDEPKEPQDKDEPIDVPSDEIGLVIENGQIGLNKKYFNELTKVDGVSTIQNPSNLLVLANKSFYLPSEYNPGDLVQPDVPFVFEGADQNYLRKVASDALEKMFADALDKGLHLIARSGYRSYNIQAIVFQRNVDEMGYDEAIQVSAKPGTSEHQTGLAMDITANSVGQQLTQDFGKTKEGIWLKENAHKYGFILRYPKGKEEITKYSYEPWHFRYVGKEAAKVIYENNWTFEEFFDVVKEI